jgi:hypothetical protein
LKKETDMKRKLIAATLALAMLPCGVLLGQSGNVRIAKASPPDPPAAYPPDPPAPSPARPQPQPQAQTPTTTRPEPAPAERRAYNREVYGRRHHRISKQQWIFLGAVAGTPMAIGALAGGAEGRAVGAIVGGWGAFVAHKFWRHLH